MKLGNFFYTHLALPGPDVGEHFNQGNSLGPLQAGTFGSQGQQCGWAQQSDGWFHVHWGFPNEDLVIGDWTLSMSTQNWTNGAETISPGD